MVDQIDGFYAYASKPYDVTKIIESAVKLGNEKKHCNFSTWEENDIAGRQLTAPIFEGLQKSNILIADITSINFNVTFEIGYAIGLGRRVFLTKSGAHCSEDNLIKRIGIYDTLGYQSYANAKQLAAIISGIRDLHPIDTSAKQNRKAPVYIIETPHRDEAMSHIISRIKKARLQYRSFAPEEESRMSAIEAVSHVSSSYGVVVPLLNPNKKDAVVHNIRAAFVAGLAFGLELPCLLLQEYDSPLAPLDVRDFVSSFRNVNDLRRLINEFSVSVLDGIQQTKGVRIESGNLLSSLSIGDPMAENEFQSLGQYYLPTNEFNRALRGEVNLVVGRKGTGKTALFSQVRNKKRSNKNNIVVDLKPQGYQLLKLKEEVLDYLSEGAKHHLVTALWEYLLYTEITYKILEKDRVRHLRDHKLLDGYVALERIYKESSQVAEGDFSERLLTLSTSIISEYESLHSRENENKLTVDEITSLLHSGNILKLRRSLSNYLKHKDEIWLLFDNLDKGWSTHGLVTGDVIILRCLIDASRKIQREMSREGLDFHGIVFVRNDVYQLLMDQTADFGKETKADLDWHDPDMLRSMLRKRLIQNDLPPEAPFEDLWNSICVSHIDGEETAQYLIDRSLMRPRNFLKLFSACRGFAVNLQHEKILEEDIRKGLRVYSNDLVVDADQELTDIEVKASRIIYQFLGESSEYSRDELRILLDVNDLTQDEIDQIIEFLLYYGFLGIRYSGEEPQYIYDVGYNMEILKTRISKNSLATKFCFNPAFWPALEIENKRI